VNLDFSKFFNPGSTSLAGKYSGLSGFESGLDLGGLVASKPDLNQTVLDTRESTCGVIWHADNETGELLDLKDTWEVRRAVRKKETLKNKLAYDKAQMKEAFPYLMAREIPRQISEGFANQSALNILGARSAVDAMNQTLQAYPRMTFQTSAFNPQKYLS
jgi:hypothetical protein